MSKDRLRQRPLLARFDSGSRAARGLALVPVVVGIVLAVLQMPRAAAPDFLPLPTVDGRALEAVVAKDRERASRARVEALPYEARDLGGAIRELFVAQARAASEDAIYKARQVVDRKLALALEHGAEPVLALRAVQLDTFLGEVRAYEASGKVSPELEAVGGAFIEHMKEAGWTQGSTVLLSEAERRVAYKLAWSSVANLEGHRDFSLTLDETRVLFTLYLTRPHPGEQERSSIELLRKGAKTPQECALIAERERNASESWRTEKVRRLALADPTYPGEYALGVQFYRIGDFRRAREHFELHVKSHPDGPWSLRAKNHLIATIATQDL